MRDVVRFPVTARLLEDMSACESQIELFREIFANEDQVILSEQVFLRALDGGLDLMWFLRHSVSEPAYHYAVSSIARQASYYLRGIITRELLREKYATIMMDAIYTQLDMNDELRYVGLLPKEVNNG